MKEWSDGTVRNGTRMCVALRNVLEEHAYCFVVATIRWVMAGLRWAMMQYNPGYTTRHVEARGWEESGEGMGVG